MTISAFNDELAQVRTKKKEFLTQIERIVPWKEWLCLIQPCYYKGERGNKPYPLEIIHIPHSASYSGFYRCIGVIHAVQHNPGAGWITAPREFHLTAAEKWHIHLGSSFSESFINRVRIHSPSSPWHRKPCAGKGHPSHSWDAVQTGFSVCAGGPVWERYSGLVLFGLEFAWFGFFTIYLHFLRHPFSDTE